MFHKNVGANVHIILFILIFSEWNKWDERYWYISVSQNLEEVLLFEFLLTKWIFISFYESTIWTDDIAFMIPHRLVNEYNILGVYWIMYVGVYLVRSTRSYSISYTTPRGSNRCTSCTYTWLAVANLLWHKSEIF